jgi:hypothetical protein
MVLFSHTAHACSLNEDKCMLLVILWSRILSSLFLTSTVNYLNLLLYRNWSCGSMHNNYVTIPYNGERVPVSALEIPVLFQQHHQG